MYCHVNSDGVPVYVSKDRMFSSTHIIRFTYEKLEPCNNCKRIEENDK